MNPRRSFLAAAGWSALSYSRVSGANERVRLGGIGLGGRCRYLLQVARQHGEAHIAAVSDVYTPRREETLAKIAPGARTFVDYRALLDAKDIDAVVIGSPDHWHVPMTIDAVRAGKDVYVEKPLTRTLDEGPLILRAVEHSGRIVQVGYQQRSWPHFQEAARIVASGQLGAVTLVMASWYQDYLGNDPRKQVLNIDQLDWNRWLGAASPRPPSPVIFFRWRWLWDFGGGHLTDLYSHYCDVIHWYMGKDTPESAQAMGGRYVLDYLECPDTINASWQYPGYLVVYQGAMISKLEGGNIVFRGSKALLRINRDGFTVYPEGVVPAEKTHYPPPLVETKSVRDGTIDHVLNFLDSVRTRRPPNAPVSACLPAARAAHLGNLAYRQGTRTTFPPA
jgi:predicted dehydrogenase